MDDKGTINHMNENTDLLVDPSLEALREEVLRLRAEAAGLIARRDDLLYRICPEIERRYIRELGSLEFLVFQEKVTVLALRRMIQLAQQAINIRRQFSENKIKKKVEAEYKNYEKQYHQAKDAFEEKKKQIDEETARQEKPGSEQESNTSEAAAEEEADLKSIYRRLIKRLHPDINPSVTDRERELFNRVVEAYKKGDLKALQELELLLDQEGVLPEGEASGLSSTERESLEKEKERLLAQIRSLHREIDEICRSYPYSRLSILEDPKELERMRSQLQKELEEAETVKPAYAAAAGEAGTEAGL